MTRWLHSLLFLMAIAASLTASLARADDQQQIAKQKFGEGAAAHARGEYLTAAGLFEEAHRLLPAAGAKFNAGIAWDQAREFPRAADAYETALEMGGLTEEEAAQAGERLGALKKLLGYVSIDAPVGAMASVEHAHGPVPLRVHLVPGIYEIRAENQGATSKSSVEVRAGDIQHVLLVFAAKERSSTPAAPPAAPPPHPLLPDRRQRERAERGGQTWGWIALLGGVALSGVAAVLGAETLEARNQWDATGHRDLGKRDRAVTLRTWTNVAWGGALVAGATGALLLAPTVRF